MSGGGWEKSIYHKKYPWQLGQHSSVWISSCCFCMFLMLSLEVSKHKEDKLSVPASVTEWVNDLVPDIFSPVYLSVNWKKVFLHCQKLGHCPCLSVSFSSVEFIILPGPVVSVGYPMPCYTNVCISLLLSAWGDCRLFFWDWGCCCCGYQSAVDQRVSGGRHLHLFSSTCQPDCICYLKSEWCFVFQQLQMRLQEKEQEVDDLIIQIQAEKVLSFFCSSLRVAPSSSKELQIVQNMDLCLITVTL